MNKNIKKNILRVSILITGILVAGAIAGLAAAQTETQTVPEISYPVVELDNCANKAACQVYCDKEENVDVCLAFAEKNNLISKEEIEIAKKFRDMGFEGPGGCKGKDTCDNYCSNAERVSECISFAEVNNLMPPNELNEARKVQAAIAKGIKPPACGGKKSCDAYCSSSEHMEECINFAIEAGIMDEQKQGEAKKVLAAIKKGIVPPACKGQEECDVYCSSSEHMEECINFAVEAGIMSDTEKEKTQKVLAAIKQGIKPPACKGEEKCKIYCAQESNLEECITFGEAIGMIKKEDAEIIRKTGGKGPGGCVGKDACDAFCNNPDNQETCFQFGKDNGMISEEDLKKIESSQQQIKESFNNMPAEVLTCLTISLGVDTIEKLKSGNAMPGQKMAEQMKTCFESFIPTPPSKPDGQAGDKQGQPTQPTPPQQPTQPTKPEKPPDAVNPTECIEDCELVGRNCMGQAGEKSNVCLSKGTYCRTVTCETFGAGGTRPTTQEEWNRCASYCRTIEDNCYAGISPTDSDCRTTKDGCVTQCQKAAKPGGPGPGVQGGPGGTGPGAGGTGPGIGGPGPSGAGSGTGPGPGGGN